MFKSARWRSEKNKVKVEFKLQFRATKVPLVGDDALVISVVPADFGKPTVKSEKVVVRDGSCSWENPVYETVKFNRDPKSGKINERIYYFVVGTVSSKARVIGEVSFDFSKYVEATKVSLVSLPLKNSKTEAILHVSIQRMQDLGDQSEVEENEIAKLDYKGHSLRAQLSNCDIDAAIKSNSEDMGLKTAPQIAVLAGNRRASSGSDLTMSSSESCSGIESDSNHQEPAEILPSMKHQGPKSDTQTALHVEHQRSKWEWLRNSALVASTDDSSSTPRETFPRPPVEETLDIVVMDKLKHDIVALSRQAEVSELELQTLRKLIVKETKRGQDLYKELVCVKEERDVLKGECEKLKAFQTRLDDTDSQYGGGDSTALIEELRQELNHAKELNSNLQLQLQKTQESNSELLLAVQDLDAMIEQQSREVGNHSSRSQAIVMAVNSPESGSMHRLYDENDDEEQRALEELVKEHSDSKEAYLLEQQIMDMRSEIEIFRRNKDELEIQMEQLALDYEILKQENHEMAYKLEQSQIQEQLKMQYECSSSYAAAQELETQIENLENELKRQSKISSDALVKSSELEAHVKNLEKELEKQSQVFEADLEALTQTKVEQEQRAIRAEETLKKTRWQNSNTAERLQEELRRLSMHMVSTFAANEKLATKAIAEANELRVQKNHLEEVIRKASEEQESNKGQDEARMHELASQVISMTNQIERMQFELEDKVLQLERQKQEADKTQKILSDELASQAISMTNQIERMQSELEDKVLQLEHQKQEADKTQKILSDEILKLKEEVKTCKARNKVLSEEVGSKATLIQELEQMRISIKEMELLNYQGNTKRTELENGISIATSEAEESKNELNKMRYLLEEKESIARNLQSDLDSLQSHFLKLQHSIVEDANERDKLKEQVFLLKSDLKKNEDALSSMEKKTMDGCEQRTTLEEFANLKERIKSLECQIKLKESALETSSHAFLLKEQDLHCKIVELETQLAVLSQSSIHHCENEVETMERAMLPRDEAPDFIEESKCNDCNGTKQSNADNHMTLSPISDNNNAIHDDEYTNELKSEMALLKEKNESMEEELKEMQGRYSEISLKFAEVEGERQQLLMRMRNMKNAKKKA